MQALFIGQTYIDVTFITDHMPTGDEKHVASDYAVSFGGNAVTAAFARLAPAVRPLAGTAARRPSVRRRLTFTRRDASRHRSHGAGTRSHVS